MLQSRDLRFRLVAPRYHVPQNVACTTQRCPQTHHSTHVSHLLFLSDEALLIQAFTCCPSPFKSLKPVYSPIKKNLCSAVLPWPRAGSTSAHSFKSGWKTKCAVLSSTDWQSGRDPTLFLSFPYLHRLVVFHNWLHLKRHALCCVCVYLRHFKGRLKINE